MTGYSFVHKSMFQGCRSFSLSLGEPFPIALLKIRYQSKVNTITADSNGQMSGYIYQVPPLVTGWDALVSQGEFHVSCLVSVPCVLSLSCIQRHEPMHLSPALSHDPCNLSCVSPWISHVPCVSRHDPSTYHVYCILGYEPCNDLTFWSRFLSLASFPCLAFRI